MPSTLFSLKSLYINHSIYLDLLVIFSLINFDNSLSNNIEHIKINENNKESKKYNEIVSPIKETINIEAEINDITDLLFFLIINIYFFFIIYIKFQNSKSIILLKN